MLHNSAYRTISLVDELTNLVKNKGADFMHFVDISGLPDKQNKGFRNAILIGIILSPAYIKKVSNTDEYVEKMIENNEVEQDEFHLVEKKTDRLSDFVADYLLSNNFYAYSQSEDNIETTGYYNAKTKSTPLPHKSIAGLAGLGWIGKNNLLVTPDYGCAISMCTVLTNTPLKTVLFSPQSPKCGECNVCVDICPVNALKGNAWEINKSRDELVDVNKCTTCIECMVHCPWTQKYMKRSL